VDFELGAAADDLRAEVRRLVRAQVPADFLGAFTNDPADLEVAQRFCRQLAQEGLLCAAWPRLGAPAPPRASAFVCALDVHPLDDAGGPDVGLALVLPCWTLLGMLDRATELTRAHVLGREQFGQTLASFQGVQFQLTDAEVERAGLDELARYALWSWRARPDEALRDALALRLAALDAAQAVFRVAHQLHGAMGFCDETPLSWLSRYSQPLRLPLGLAATGAELTARLGRSGLHALFDRAEPWPR